MEPAQESTAAVGVLLFALAFSVTLWSQGGLPRAGEPPAPPAVAAAHATTPRGAPGEGGGAAASLAPGHAAEHVAARAAATVARVREEDRQPAAAARASARKLTERRSFRDFVTTVAALPADAEPVPVDGHVWVDDTDHAGAFDHLLERRGD